MTTPDGLTVPNGYRRPKPGERPTHVQCQCQRSVLRRVTPLRDRTDAHRCVWTPLVIYDERQASHAKD